MEICRKLCMVSWLEKSIKGLIFADPSDLSAFADLLLPTRKKKSVPSNRPGTHQTLYSRATTCGSGYVRYYQG